MDQTGQWLASGGDDGLLRLWEVKSGRCMRSWDLQAPIHCLAWCPNQTLRLLSAASASHVILLPSGECVAGQCASTLLFMPLPDSPIQPRYSIDIPLPWRHFTVEGAAQAANSDLLCTLPMQTCGSSTRAACTWSVPGARGAHVSIAAAHAA